MYEVLAGVRSTSSDDGGIVLDINLGQMFRLNPVGAFILDQLQKGHSEAKISEDIARRYDIDEEMAATDVRTFLKELEEYKLVRTQPGERIS